MKQFVLGSALAVVLAAGASGVVSAQESAATPTIPSAAECIIEPIAFERLAPISATPPPAVATAEASPTAVTALPAGEAADEEITAAVHNTATQLIACLNAGDSLRTLSLYSDTFIAGGFAGLNITQEMYDAESTNLQPRPAGQEVALISLGDVVILEDGRAAIIVEGDDLSSPGEASGTLFYLVEVDGMWLIDDTVELTGSEE
jgi:hypothetical protein